MCTQKMRALYIWAEKITFPPKPDIQTYRQTYRHTYRRTDISVYRVASLQQKNEKLSSSVINFKTSKQNCHFEYGIVRYFHAKKNN